MFPASELHLRDQEDQNLAESNFLELLQSMWQHGDSEEEDDFKETAGEERDMEEERERGDGEKEDRVDEEELDEIYEFAVTQRKIETMLETATEEEEADAKTSLGNEKNEEGKEKKETESLLEKSAGSCYSNKQGVDGTEDAMVTSPTENPKNPYSETERVCLIPELDENRDSDASLDKSYDCLFSQSVGEYMEPSQTQASCSQQQCYKPSSTLQQNTPAPFRRSCVSEVIDLSISPPPSSGVSGETSFPMPGVSPVPHEGEDIGKSPLRIDSSGCQGNPPSPPESQSKQVELIVLSDSGDEMDVDNGDQNAAQLFPKSSSSSSSSSVSEGLKPASSASSSSCLNEKPSTLSKLHKSYRSPSKEGHSIDTDCSPGYQRALHHLRLSQVSSSDVSDGSHIGIIMGHPIQGVPEPSSSTPLHSDSSLQRQIPFCSPMVDDREVRLRNCRGNSRSFCRQGKVDLVSLQLSSPSKTPAKQHSSPLQQGCSSPTPNSPRCIRPESSRGSENDGIEQMELGENPNQSVDEVVDIAGNSFCVMDEPPIAFDDSWGLDGGLGSQKPCFSLRLDSSGGTVSPPGLEGKRPTSTSPLATGACNKSPDPSPGLFNHSLPDPDMWDDCEEEEVAPLPLSQRLTVPSAKRVAELKTPVASRKRNEGPLVPITPMPGFSDMETPELKNRLNRFGVRPLPKKQMVLKLKEIHQYTHQLQSSESEEETSVPQRHPNASNSQSAPLPFKQPTAPPAASPVKLPPSEEDELLSASQNSNTSSTAESERSNPELCVSDDDDSDSEGITASQAVVREKDKLLAVRQFILSDPKLYARVLQYQPLSLAELQSSLKAAGIRLGAAKLLDFLDSQCITFSTAKHGQKASSRRKRRVKTTTSGGAAAGRGRKKAAKPSGGIA
uniref:Structure-specific endonuclease subunit SLX4 n=1 Tax=Cyprinus carpio TaxID=7962 RepID=A0A8C2I7S5_CYPCA